MNILKAIARNGSWISITLMTVGFLVLVPHQPELAPKQNVAFSFFVQLLVSAALFVVAQLLMPTPQVENAKRGGIDDFSFPTNQEERSIPVSYGTNRITGPNMTWYGALVADPITEKIGGLFDKKKVIIGWRYYLAFDLAVCYGQIDAITEVRVTNKAILTAGGVLPNGDVVPTTGWSEDNSVFTIDRPDFYGGSKKGGGLAGILRMYNGSTVGHINEFAATDIGEDSKYLPGYPGICRIVWEGGAVPEPTGDVGPIGLGGADNAKLLDGRGGYVGERTSIGKWDLTVHSYPNPLALTGDKHIINPVSPTGQGDANPINCLYDILTHSSYGVGIPTDRFDIASFITAAETCYAEGLGFSFLMQSEQTAKQVVDLMLDHVGGVMFQNSDGDFSIKLVRDDYALLDQKLFDPSNTVKITSVAKTSWSQTSNSSSVEYVDWQSDFKSTNALAYDLGNIETLGGVQNQTKKKFPGCRNASTAATLAARTLTEVSSPLVAVTLEVNRDGADVNPGDVVRITDPDFELDNTAVRVTEVTRGNADNSKITIQGVEDIFAFPTAVNFTGGQSTLHDGDVAAPVAATTTLRGMTWYERCRFGGGSDTNFYTVGNRDNTRTPVHEVVANDRNSRSFEILRYDSVAQIWTLDSGYIPVTQSLEMDNVTNQYKNPLRKESDIYVADGGPSIDHEVPIWATNTAYVLGDITRDAAGSSLRIVTTVGTGGVSGDTAPSNTLIAEGQEWDNSVVGVGYGWTVSKEVADVRSTTPAISLYLNGQSSFFTEQSAQDIQSTGAGLIKINDEFMAYESVAYLVTSDEENLQPDWTQTEVDRDLNGVAYISGKVAVGLNGIHRGLLDSDIVEHPVGSSVVFVNPADPATNVTDDELIDGHQGETFKHLTSGAFGRLQEVSAPSTSISATEMNRFSYPVRVINAGVNGQRGEAGHGPYAQDGEPGLWVGNGSVQAYFCNQYQFPNMPSDYAEILLQSSTGFYNNDTKSFLATYNLQFFVESYPGSGYSSVKTDTGTFHGSTSFTTLSRTEIATALNWTGWQSEASNPYNSLTCKGYFTVSTNQPNAWSGKEAAIWAPDPSAGFQYPAASLTSRYVVRRDFRCVAPNNVNGTPVEDLPGVQDIIDAGDQFPV